MPVPNQYAAGATIRVFTQCSISGTLTDPSVLTLYIKTPTGALSTLVFGSSSIVKDGTGLYHYDLLTAGSGPYSYRWVATGGAFISAAQENEFIAGPSNFV